MNIKSIMSYTNLLKQCIHEIMSNISFFYIHFNISEKGSARQIKSRTIEHNISTNNKTVLGTFSVLVNGNEQSNEIC